MTKKKKSRASRDAVRVQNGALRAARLGAIKTDILDNLRQPTLSIHAVAHRHGISARYIRQLFAADGMSFADFVLDRRLAAVHLMLSDSALPIAPSARSPSKWVSAMCRSSAAFSGAATA